MIHVVLAAALSGSLVSIADSGWPVGTTVSLNLGGGDTGAAGDYGTGVADGNGRFQAYVTLWTLPNGQPIRTPGAIVLLSVLIWTNARHGVNLAP